MVPVGCAADEVKVGSFAGGLEAIGCAKVARTGLVGVGLRVAMIVGPGSMDAAQPPINPAMTISQSRFFVNTSLESEPSENIIRIIQCS